jgi:electron transport complex protein RnfG
LAVKLQYLKQAWLVVVLAVVFGGALVGVQSALQGRIAANKLNETYGQIPNLVVVEESGRQKRAVKELTQEVVVGGNRVYKAFWRDGPEAPPEHIGWVLSASGQGFADRIEVLIGLDAPARKILGLYVLEQKETPGLGEKIRSDWARQFAGKSAVEDLRVVKTTPAGNEIQAITGATVSSSGVCRIVNIAVIEFRNALIAGKTVKE